MASAMCLQPATCGLSQAFTTDLESDKALDGNLTLVFFRALGTQERTAVAAKLGGLCTVAALRNIRERSLTANSNLGFRDSRFGSSRSSAGLRGLGKTAGIAAGRSGALWLGEKRHSVLLSTASVFEYCRQGRGLHLVVGRLMSMEAAVVIEPEERREALDAAQVVGELRKTVKSGRTKSEGWRLEQLNGVLKMVAEREKEISEALFKDLGKPAYESFIYELALVKGSCEHAIKELKNWMAPQKACQSTSKIEAKTCPQWAHYIYKELSVAGTLATYPSSAAIVSEPLGVTLVMSAWNFPFLLSIDPMIGAISAGCALVLKPSEVAPATSAFLAKFVPQYLDGSAIRVVEGGVPETTELLEQNWDKIFYTGNPKVGRIVMAAASKHLTPVTLELGGKCPVYIDSTANLKVTLKRVAVGKWGNNNGQACIAPDYVLVEESIASQVVEEMKQTIVRFFGEDPRASKDLSRVVNSSHFSRLTRMLDESRTASKIVHGGERDEESLYVAPTLLFDIPMDVPIMAEEIFGPILPIIKVKGVTEAIEFINDRPKPLAAYVFTTKKEVEQQFVADVSAGGMVVNDTSLHFVVPGLPFGGVGESGVGSYHGKFSFDSFSHKKSVLYRTFGGDVFARYPPYTSKKESFVRSLLSGDFVGVALVMVGLKK